MMKACHVGSQDVVLVKTRNLEMIGDAEVFLMRTNLTLGSVEDSLLATTIKNPDSLTGDALLDLEKKTMICRQGSQGVEDLMILETGSEAGIGKRKKKTLMTRMTQTQMIV
jgi:hypothetical protein